MESTDVMFMKSDKDDIVSSIRQDVILAGSEGHYVPIRQWRQQIRMYKPVLDYRAAVCPERASAESLPSRQLQPGVENALQLAGRDAAVKGGGTMTVIMGVN